MNDEPNSGSQSRPRQTKSRKSPTTRSIVHNSGPGKRKKDHNGGFALEALGKRIQRLRKSLGESQEAFAERVGVTKSSLVEYEKGRRSPGYDALTSIVVHTGCSPGWLFADHGEMFPALDVAESAGAARLDRAAEAMLDTIDALAESLDELIPLLPPTRRRDVLGRVLALQQRLVVPRSQGEESAGPATAKD